MFILSIALSHIGRSNTCMRWSPSHSTCSMTNQSISHVYVNAKVLFCICMHKFIQRMHMQTLSFTYLHAGWRYMHRFRILFGDNSCMSHRLKWHRFIKNFGEFYEICSAHYSINVYRNDIYSKKSCVQCEIFSPSFPHNFLNKPNLMLK